MSTHCLEQKRGKGGRKGEARRGWTGEEVEEEEEEEERERRRGRETEEEGGCRLPTYESGASITAASNQ